MGRSSHAACCINYGEDHPQVLVSGGVVFNSHRHEALSDLWLLDVDSAKWKEVSYVHVVKYLVFNATLYRMS